MAVVKWNVARATYYGKGALRFRLIPGAQFVSDAAVAELLNDPKENGFKRDIRGGFVEVTLPPAGTNTKPKYKLPSKEEYIKSGYAAKNYAAFIKMEKEKAEKDGLEVVMPGESEPAPVLTSPDPRLTKTVEPAGGLAAQYTLDQIKDILPSMMDVEALKKLAETDARPEVKELAQARMQQILGVPVVLGEKSEVVKTAEGEEIPKVNDIKPFIPSVPAE